MALCRRLQVLIGVAAISLWSRSVGFVAPESSQWWQGDHQVLTSPRADRERMGPTWAAMPDVAPRAFKQQSGGMAWGFALGLSLVGATLAQRRRECGARTSAGVMRFKHIFGGDGAPKEHKWLDYERPYKGAKSGLTVPAWMNREKIMSLPAGNRARSIRWYLQYFDEDGNVAVPKGSLWKIEEAVNKMIQFQQRAPIKFDPTVELKMKMNLNPQFPDQQIRFTVDLPHGTGKEVKVAVFCDAEDEEEVMGLGAYKCGKLLAEEISEENIDFDVLLTKPAMMPRLAKLGKILGPRKLMPSPKSGTVVTDYAVAIESFKKGAVELRNSYDMRVNCIVGKVSFGRDKIMENVRSVLQQMAEKAPDGATSNYWTFVKIKSTMSPMCSVDPSEWPQVVSKKSTTL